MVWIQDVFPDDVLWLDMIMVPGDKMTDLITI